MHSIDPYPSYVHMYAQSGKWEDCQRLCRFVDRKHLWACLAAMSLQNRDVSTAIAAYAALSNVSVRHRGILSDMILSGV